MNPYTDIIAPVASLPAPTSSAIKGMNSMLIAAAAVDKNSIAFEFTCIYGGCD